MGQDHIRLTLLHEIQKGTLTHAYLFAGPRGTGKTSTARLIAKALNCTNRNEEGEPCDECDFCKTIAEGSLIDVLEIDAASNRGIDEIRDLKEKINFAPTRAKTKVYIIDEVHMLTKEAFNALLKTLEEPPENVYFILCTTEIHKIPETIISRCQRFDFKRIDAKTIMTRLSFIAQMEKIAVEDAAVELIARHVEGGLRDAIGLMEQLTIEGKLTENRVRDHLGITGHSVIETLLDLLEKQELAKAIHVVNSVHNEGYDLTAFTREILECLRDRLITGIQQGKSGNSPMLSAISHFEEARDMLRNTVIPQLPLEIAVIKICGSGAPIQAISEEAPVKEPETPLPATDQKPEISAAAQKAEEKTAETLKREIEFERLQGDIGKHWVRVLEHLEPPALRRSLNDAVLREEKDDVAKLIFRSRFHMEKVDTAENRAKIEKAIEHLFGKKVKLACELDAGAPKTSTAEPQSVKLPSKQKSKKIDLAKKAMEIFGEE